MVKHTYTQQLLILRADEHYTMFKDMYIQLYSSTCFTGRQHVNMYMCYA